MLSKTALPSQCATHSAVPPTCSFSRQFKAHASADLAHAVQRQAPVAGACLQLDASRRSLLGSAALLTFLAGQASRVDAAAQSAEVGGYLPKAGIDDLVTFVPGKVQLYSSDRKQELHHIKDSD